MVAHQLRGLGEVSRGAHVEPGAVDGKVAYFLATGYCARNQVGSVGGAVGVHAAQNTVVENIYAGVAK